MMACIFLAYILMAYILMAYILRAYILMDGQQMYSLHNDGLHIDFLHNDGLHIDGLYIMLNGKGNLPAKDEFTPNCATPSPPPDPFSPSPLAGSSLSGIGWGDDEAVDGASLFLSPSSTSAPTSSSEAMSGPASKNHKKVSYVKQYNYSLT